MDNERHLGLLEYGKLLATLAALAGFLLFTGAPRVSAGESECEHRTERADHRLHEAIEHHGWDSPQPETARHQLREARQDCWSPSNKGGTPHAHRAPDARKADHDTL